MHYVTLGTGPLIVFLHGFPEFWYSWRNQIPLFAKHFKVVVPDLRGFGQTEKPKEINEYKIDNLVKDIVELIRYLGRERAIIAGHDWGGIIGWSVAMAAPEVVEKLIIMNAPHPASYQRNVFKNIAQMQKSWYVFFFLLQRVPEKVLNANNFQFLRYMFDLSIKRKHNFTQSDVEKYVDAWNKAGGISGGINYYRANLGPDFWESLVINIDNIQLPKIKSPTLMIWGEDDSFLGKELTEETATFIDAPFSLKFIPNCGHWVQQEAPAEVNDIMEKFLGD
jgi:pimeloyl-ACP methyl ester carboxylesterase